MGLFCGCNDANLGEALIQCPTKSATPEDTGDRGSRGNLIRDSLGTGFDLLGQFGLLRRAQPWALPDVFNRGSDDRCFIGRMAKFEVHAAANVLSFQHGASPGRAGDGDQYGLRAELGMPGNQSRPLVRAVVQKHCGVAVVLGLDLQHGRGWEVFKEDTAFNVGLDNLVIHFIAEVGMGREK